MLEELARGGGIITSCVEDFQIPPYINVNFVNNIRPWMTEYAPVYRLDIITQDGFACVLSPLRIDIDYKKPIAEQTLPLSFVYVL